MYRADLFRGPKGCRHDAASSGCEHISLSECIQQNFDGKQLLATGLVVDWEGCDEQQQHRWEPWGDPPPQPT